MFKTKILLQTKRTNSFLHLVINNYQKGWNSTIPITSDFLDERKMGKKIVNKIDLIEDVMRISVKSCSLLD
jgi:hypothetical protein